MEGETTLSVKNMSAADIKLESLFDVSVRGETNTLVGRWALADVMFSIEHSNVVEEERVCMRTSLAYDEREVEEGLFLILIGRGGIVARRSSRAARCSV